MTIPLRIGCWLAFLLACNGAHAENWVEFYYTGRGMPPNVVWDTFYYVDADSIRQDGSLWRYRTKVVRTEAERSDITEMMVDCSAKKRGQLPGRDLYDTYQGTLSGEEVKTVCRLASQRSL